MRATSSKTPPLVLERFILSGRITLPSFACLFWNWDGQITMHIQGSSKWISEEAWEMYGQAVRDRFQDIIDQVD